MTADCDVDSKTFWTLIMTLLEEGHHAVNPLLEGDDLITPNVFKFMRTLFYPPLLQGSPYNLAWAKSYMLAGQFLPDFMDKPQWLSQLASGSKTDEQIEDELESQFPGCTFDIDVTFDPSPPGESIECGPGGNCVVVVYGRVTGSISVRCCATLSVFRQPIDRDFRVAKNL